MTESARRFSLEAAKASYKIALDRWHAGDAREALLEIPRCFAAIERAISGTDPGEDQVLADRIFAWASRRKLSGFTAQDAYQAVKGGGTSMTPATVAPAIALLVASKRILPMHENTPPRRGRPRSQMYAMSTNSPISTIPEIPQ